MTTVYVARHGETEWNLAGQIMGRHNSPLSQRGILQAKTLAVALTDVSVAAVYTSPLGRAKETATIVAKSLKLPEPIVIESLQERSYGPFEARPGIEYKQALADWLAAHGDETESDFDTAMGVEDRQDLVERITAALTDIAQKHDNQTVLAVSHGSVLRTLLGSFDTVDDVWLQPGGLPNAGYIGLSYTKDAGLTFESIHRIDAVHLPEQV